MTFTVTVKNAGQTAATGVTLSRHTACLSDIFSSATGGVTPDSKTGLIFHLGTLAPGASATVDIVMNPRKYTAQRAATAQRLCYRHNGTARPSPNDNSIILGTVAFGYEVTGCRGRTTAFMLSFGEPVDPAWAQNINNYQLVALHGAGAGSDSRRQNTTPLQTP